jgi:hypothetical protein
MGAFEHAVQQHIASSRDVRSTTPPKWSMIN